MLTDQQNQCIDAIERLDLSLLQQLLAQGLDPNFIDHEKGPPLSVLCDRLFTWWEMICDAYEVDKPLTEEEKNASLQVYLEILELLIQSGANVHLWDSEEFYGPLWDATSAACVPVVQRLLDAGVDPNTTDEQNLTILSSISELWFDCDFDQVNWDLALPEEKATLTLLRENGAKMSKEL